MANYSSLKVDTDANLFKLTFSCPGGDFCSRFQSQKFATNDKDNDGYGGNCAVTSGGGFWWYLCQSGGINGAIPNSSSYGFVWNGHYLKASRMYLQCF